MCNHFITRYNEEKNQREDWKPSVYVINKRVQVENYKTIKHGVQSRIKHP